MTGIEVFLEVLSRAGVRYLFGNPGTTELPLNAALTRDDRFQYILGVQEIPVVSMADGYAMASGDLGVVNVHIGCGLGNAMGMLYNAHVEGTPLLLTAGQQDRRLRLSDPVLAADLVSVARPWTKWAYDVQRVEDVAPATRRAAQTALTRPTGPVFLSLPVDLQTEWVAEPGIQPMIVPDQRVRPSHEGLREAAARLGQARNPVIVAGSRVTEADATAELVSLAERLGAPVFAESTTMHGRLPMSSNHPLYRGILPLWSPDIRETLAEFDVLLAVGVNVFRLYIYHQPANPLPEQIGVIHLDSMAAEIGKNYAVDVGLVGDIKCGLADLVAALSVKPSPAVEKRRRFWADRQAEEQNKLRKEIAAAYSLRPLTSLGLMGALVRGMPADTAVVEEAITTHRNVWERLGALKDPKAFFAHRGWALGWGMGCALGVKLAWPDRPVLALIGDGAALYGIQALWTAAHSRIPVTFVIAHNARYQILKDCGSVMDLPGLGLPSCRGLELVDPVVDFVGLARSFGVDARRIEEPDALTEAVRSALASTKPKLIEVPVASQSSSAAH